jgi:superfamily II DNA or RNA helicase
MQPTGDLFYSPKMDWLTSLDFEFLFSGILFIGEPNPELTKKVSESGVETRHYTPTRKTVIPTGTTIFKSHAGEWFVSICSEGNASLDPVVDGRQDYLDDDNPLITLTMAYATFWQQGKTLGGSATFGIGDTVQILPDNTVGKIDKVQIIAGEPRYAVLTSRGILNVFESELERLEIMPGDSSTWINNRPANADTIALTITATKLRDPLTDVIYSFQTSRTLFRPYQFRPVLKILTGVNQRLLIADEVGLGKTIEAGLIWSELEFRSPLDSVLVVCPSALKRKWQTEMKNRFDRDLKDLTNQALGEWIETLEKGRPDKLTAVASLEGLRTSKHLDRLVELGPRFDLVIVDEAHYLRNVGNRSNDLGRYLSDWADAMIFLSATPLNLGTSDLFNLLSLLDDVQFFDKNTFEQQIEPNKYLNAVARELAGLNIKPRELLPILDKIRETEMADSILQRSDFERLSELLEQESLTQKDISDAKRHLGELNSLASVFSRTRKADTPEKRARREPISVFVEWTEQEREIYDAIRSFLIGRALKQGKIPGFQLQNPLRQAASCLPAVLELLKGEKYGLTERDEDDDYLEFTSDDDEDAIPEPSIHELITQLGQLPKIKIDSKYRDFEEGLRRARAGGSKQALVFSFFTRTILYLEKRLKEDGYKVKIMYGKTPPDQRQLVMKQFRDQEFDILICSEVGSEGLDFEFCNILVNYDLPWNPMRVEQRIGRLDRFGQLADKIFILNIRVPGTIEDDIFMRLFDRIGVFEDSIGELEPILRDEVRNITSVLLNPALTASERNSEVQRFGVAVEKRKNDLNDLATHKNLVAGIDAFLIEGFDEHTPGRGRFLGKEEVIRVTGRYLTKNGGSISQIDNNHWLVSGSQSIATSLREQIRISTSGTTIGIATLARELDGRAPGLTVTFDPEVAAKENIELISVRNPLLRCVKDDLVANENLWSRFGCISIPANPNESLKRGGRYLVGIHLARAQSVRPTLELWTTTFDLNDGVLVTGPGDALLQSLASNTFTNTSVNCELSVLKSANKLIQMEVAERQRVQRNRLSQDHEAILKERSLAKQISLRNKISIAEQRLATVMQDNRDIRVVNSAKSRLNSLKRDLQSTEIPEADNKSSLTIQDVAYVYINVQ